jgi:hypothetical protein
MIYTHVMTKGARGVRSPLDRQSGGSDGGRVEAARAPEEAARAGDEPRCQK